MGGVYGVASVTCEILLPQGKVALVDDEDYERAMTAGPWHGHKGPNALYVHHSAPNRTSVYLHRFLLNAPKGIDVDHVNRDGLDNRRANLRLCTRPQNLANMRPGGGTSRFKGVNWGKREH